MAQAKPACGSHPHDCNAEVLSIRYNTMDHCYVHFAFVFTLYNNYIIDFRTMGSVSYLLLVLMVAPLVVGSANQHGADVEDNEFAEFEDFDDGLSFTLLCSNP